LKFFQIVANWKGKKTDNRIRRSL